MRRRKSEIRDWPQGSSWDGTFALIRATTFSEQCHGVKVAGARVWCDARVHACPNPFGCNELLGDRLRRASSVVSCSGGELHCIGFSPHLAHDMGERVGVDSKLDQLHEDCQRFAIQSRVQQRRHFMNRCG